MESIRHFSEITSSAQYHLQLQQQLLKDFYGNDEFYPENFADQCYPANEIYELIKLNTIRTIEKGERQLLQLLYKIDIPEKQFLSIIQQQGLIDELVEAVFQKEINKIYFRIKYK